MAHELTPESTPKLATAKLAKSFGGAFTLFVILLAYFAIYPSWSQGGTMLYFITMFWMAVLAAIVASFAVAVVHLGGDDVEHAG